MKLSIVVVAVMAWFAAASPINHELGSDHRVKHDGDHHKNHSGVLPAILNHPDNLHFNHTALPLPALLKPDHHHGNKTMHSRPTNELLKGHFKGHKAPRALNIKTTTTTKPTPKATTTTKPTPKGTTTTKAAAKVTTTTKAAAKVTTTTKAVPKATSAVVTPVKAVVADQAYINAALTEHNRHRSNHSAPAVTWDSDLASWAAQVAASCMFAHNISVGTHSYGQNLAMIGSTADISKYSTATLVAQATTNMWYNGEYAAYASYFGTTPSMSNFGAWGHLSQVLWKSTTQIGCATQYCPAGTMSAKFNDWYTVCNYYTPGNNGLYSTNVLKPLGAKTYTAPPPS